MYKKLNASFELEDEKTLNITSTFSLNTNYTDENKVCIATMRVKSVSVDKPDVVSIMIELVGIFECDEINTKKDKQLAHVQIYRYLFPYVQSTISDLYVKAGLPPLIIEAPLIDPDKVVIDE